MQSPISLTFRHIERSGALEARVREMGERLRRYHAGITQCRVTVDGDGADGAPYAVKIHLSVPVAQIHADSTHRNGAGHADVYAALRDAYMSARRQLQDLQRDCKSSLLGDARSVLRSAQGTGQRQRSKE
ncbi:MAG: HPF/RaiA family ribosome-associated protein [Steroidobacteraceae bacterium]